MKDVEFLTTTRIGEKGELTVPKEYRDELALEPGAAIAVIRIGSGLLLIPEHARFRQLCDRIADSFSGGGVSEADVLETLPATRKRVFARLYPELVKPSPARRERRRGR